MARVDFRNDHEPLIGHPGIELAFDNVSFRWEADIVHADQRRKEMIAASRTPEEVRAAELAERIIYEGMKVCITTRELELWVMRDSKGKSFSTAHDLRKAMINEGMFAHIKRIRIGGNLQYVLVSPALYEEYKTLFDEPEQNDRIITDLIRDNIKYPADLAGMQVSGVM